MEPVHSPQRRRILERESRIVREAISLVATGGAPRVIVASLRYGDDLLDPSRRIALEAGIRLRALRRADERGVDIAVEPISE